MEIRILTPEDYSPFLAMMEKVDALHAQARPDCYLARKGEECFPRGAYDSWMGSPDGLLLGAFEDGRMIGTSKAALWTESGMVPGIRWVCLDNIYVEEDCRRRGVAKALYARTEAWAREIGAVRMELYVWDFNRSAIAAYHSWGFVPQQYVLEKKLIADS